MDAPLVLTTILNPQEVDDEVYDVDTSWGYPLEFYQATLEYKPPATIKIEQVIHCVPSVSSRVIHQAFLFPYLSPA